MTKRTFDAEEAEELENDWAGRYQRDNAKIFRGWPLPPRIFFEDMAIELMAMAGEDITEADLDKALWNWHMKAHGLSITKLD
jgi:hypothetical protein